MNNLAKGLRKYSSSVEIKTNTFEGGVIEQEVTYPSKSTLRLVARTQDEQIKEALVRLGWAPPGQEQEAEKFRRMVSEWLLMLRYGQARQAEMFMRSYLERGKG